VHAISDGSGGGLDLLGWRLQPRIRQTNLSERASRRLDSHRYDARVPDVGFQASAGTGALVYLTLPPDGNSGLFCGPLPCSTGWYDIGGTSLSTPQWAGLVAIAAQLNGGGLGLINSALYRIGANPQRYAADFYDITTGLNQADPAVPGYPATTGWDPITGLGTPNAANLVPDLVAAVHGN